MTRVLLMVGQLGGGGAETQLMLFLRHVREVEAHCYLLNPGGVWQERVEQLATSFRVSRSGSRIVRTIEFLRLARRLRPEVIHCWHTYPAAYPLIWRRLHRRPVIVNVRGDITIDPHSGRRDPPGYLGLLRRSDLVISNSAHSLEALARQGIPLPATRVVPNGIELPDVPKSRTIGNEHRLVGAGTLNPRKNWAQLIRVCARLRERGHAVRLEIFGEGPQRAELEALCRRCDLDPGEVLPGFTDRLARHLAAADLLVHCSVSEGLPNAVLEGLAAGLPVVATDLDICRELGAAGDFLRLFPVRDDDACLERIESLLAERSDRAAMGERARDFIRGKFDCATMADRYLDAYRDVTGATDS